MEVIHRKVGKWVFVRCSDEFMQALMEVLTTSTERRNGFMATPNAGSGYFSCQNHRLRILTPLDFRCSRMPWSVGIQAMLIFSNRMPFL